MEIQSWVNGACTEEHGSHVDGTLEAFREAGWRPARVLVHVIMLEPKFSGPTRRKLRSPRALRQVRALLSPGAQLKHGRPPKFSKQDWTKATVGGTGSAHRQRTSNARPAHPSYRHLRHRTLCAKKCARHSKHPQSSPNSSERESPATS